jgi:GNAT superfamily N-acetyltransferase
LVALSRRDAEINEARWWSHWARLSQARSGCYLLTSEKFTEPFFNRAGALSCDGVARAASWAEEEMPARGLPSTVLVFESCVGGARALLASGYRTVDTMAVLVSKGAIARTRGEEPAVYASSSAGPWVSAYLRAFYGSEELAGSVIPIVNRLLKAKAATLLEAKVKGRVAGSLAMFRTGGLAGVYCVGTVPEFRKMGVATRLLARAREIADAEGRELILQTLESDGAGLFYSQRGFQHLYSKMIMEKEN